MIFHEIITQYDILYYAKSLFLNNTANTAPYHNFYHTQCVFKNCYLNAVEENMSQPDTRELLIAALYHDMGHTQGKYSDDINVSLAVSFFKLYSRESAVVSDRIVQLIKATQYPYVPEINDANISLSQKIIRDADMCQVFEDNWIQQCIFGLMVKEFNTPIIQAVAGQIAFINAMHFYTPYGLSKYEQNKQRLITELNLYTT